jgi:hypothetical protein
MNILRVFDLKEPKKNVLILESVDRGGKDSVRLACDKANDYSQINIIRGPIGYVTYNRMFNKGQDERAFIETARLLDQVAITVYLKVSVEELKRRCQETGEILRDNHRIEDQVRMYEEVVQEAIELWGLKNVHTVSNERPIEETVREILSFF